MIFTFKFSSTTSFIINIMSVIIENFIELKTILFIYFAVN